MKRASRVTVAAMLVAACALLVPVAVSAHEHRQVANGKYTFVVGFLNEPAFVGQENGLSLTVTKPASGTPAANGESAETPVEGLDKTLKAEVIYGDQKMDLPLSPGFGQPGKYQSIFFPMAAGDYSFHIYGEIEGTKVDETFTSSPNGFDAVQDPTPLQFPKSKSSVTSSVAGTVFPQEQGGGYGVGSLFGGIAAGLVIGAAGVWLVRRRPTVATADMASDS
ncbi:MAG TPA: hypothetical protein VFL82_16880 [Thermomicrobiales bacterium]|nr:hypothetical protein [Thermomicrobiales bacterium]